MVGTWVWNSGEKWTMYNLVVCHDLNRSSIRAQKTWFSEEKKNRKKAGRCEVVDFPIPYAMRVNIKKIE